MFYEVLMEKKAEADYYSRYLSERQRRVAFDQANKRRAGRKTGKSTSRTAGGVTGAVLGGLGGGLVGGAGGGVGRTLVGGGAGALIGGGLGYGMGYLGDKARDSRTREARDILKMSPKQRRDLLDSKRARRLDQEDRMRRQEERAHRAAVQAQLRNIYNSRGQNA